MAATLREDLLGAIPEPEPVVTATGPDASEEHLAEIRAELGLDADAPLQDIQDVLLDEWAFWQVFFSHLRQDRRGREIPGSPRHRQMLADTCALIRGETDQEQLAEADPREHAKTVLGVVVPAIYAICHRFRRFLVYITSTSDLARGVAGDVRAEIEGNERLRAVFPDIREFVGEPRVNFFVVGTSEEVGVAFACAGARKKIRGARWRQYRPDLVFVDDVEDDVAVHNPRLRKSLIAWMNKVVRKLGRAASFVVRGTILHPDGFLRNQIEGPADIHAAFVAYPDDLGVKYGLWGVWERIYHDRSAPNRKQRAREFYFSHREAMDAGAVLLWPGQFSVYGLMCERADDLASFLSERMNSPWDPAAWWFPEIQYKSGPDLPGPDDIVGSVAVWDPSKGKSTSDTTAVARIVRLRDGRSLVRCGVLGRMPPEEVMVAVIEGHLVDPYLVVGVEDVGVSNYTEQLQGLALARQVTLSVVTVRPEGNKDVRIKARRPLVVAGVLIFDDALPQEAKEQLQQYPQHPNDDFWDSIDHALRLADEYVTEVEDAGASVEPPADAGRLSRPGHALNPMPDDAPRIFVGAGLQLLNRLLGRG